MEEINVDELEGDYKWRSVKERAGEKKLVNNYRKQRK